MIRAFDRQNVWHTPLELSAAALLYGIFRSRRIEAQKNANRLRSWSAWIRGSSLYRQFYEGLNVEARAHQRRIAPQPSARTVQEFRIACRGWTPNQGGVEPSRRGWGGHLPGTSLWCDSSLLRHTKW